MKHISLFSGIGGFDLAATWAGWDNIVSCEINPFCNQVLSHYWPNAYHHNDIKNLNYEKINEELTKRHGENWRSDDIVLSGGFPCQPYSLAGKRKGKEDDRHLWPEMLRVIRELQPRWVVGENVFGLVNWDGGLVFNEVQSDLEAEGYEVQPYLLPACAVNAPHRRDRVWFVAHAKGDKNQRHRQGGFLAEPSGLDEQGFITNPDNTRRSTRPGEVQSTDGEVSKRDDHAQLSNTDSVTTTNSKSIGHEQSRDTRPRRPRPEDDDSNAIANSNNIELQRSEFNGSLGSAGSSEGQSGQLGGSVRSTWDVFPTQPPICGGNDGLPARLDGIAFSKWRNESIKAYGNAVVPQVVYQIFKAINEYEERARMGLV